MKRKSNAFKIVIAAVILVVIAVIGVVIGIAYRNYSLEKSYVATVAGEKVNVPEFMFFLRIVKNELETQAGVDIKDDNAKRDFWKTNIEGEVAEVKAKNRTLDQLKEFKILLIKARENKVELAKEDLDTIKSAVDEIITSEGNGNKAAASASIKKKYGISLASYEAIYKDYMLAYGKFAKSESDKLQPSDNEIKEFFDKNKNMYGDATISQIKINIMDPATNTPLTEDKLGDKKKMAEDVLKKAESGEDFANLAKQYSDDAETKDYGGEVVIKKDDTAIDQKIRDWALTAKDGEVKRIDTGNAYYILKFGKKIIFEDIKETVKEDFKQDTLNKKVEAWKKEEKYNIVKNQKILDSIKLV